MHNSLDDLNRNLRTMRMTIAEKLKELSRRGRHKLDIISLQRHIEKNFMELGGRVYHLVVEEKQTAILEDAEVAQLLNTLSKLENELKDKKQQMQAF